MSEPERLGDILKRVLPEIKKRVKPRDPQEGAKRAVRDFLKDQMPKFTGPPE